VRDQGPFHPLIIAFDLWEDLAERRAVSLMSESYCCGVGQHFQGLSLNIFNQDPGGSAGRQNQQRGFFFT
jgi:hypothetical protein